MQSSLHQDLPLFWKTMVKLGFQMTHYTIQKLIFDGKAIEVHGYTVWVNTYKAWIICKLDQLSCANIKDTQATFNIQESNFCFWKYKYYTSIF